MVHTVLATFKFKSSEDKKNFYEILKGPEGLSKTRSFEGNVSIQVYEAHDEVDTVVIYQNWDSKEAHAAYLEMRMKEGLLSKVMETLREEFEVIHLKNVSV